MLEGLPLSLFEATGWGALASFLIFSGVLIHRGAIKTKGEVDRIVQSYLDRIAELREHHEERVADKDRVISDKDQTNRDNVETMKHILDTLDGYGEHLASLDKQSAVTEQVIEALQQAVRQGGDRHERPGG